MGTDNHEIPFTDVRRAGQNPVTDYGGHEARLAGREAIRDAQLQNAGNEDGSPLRLFDDEFKPTSELIAPSDTRAVLGSMAIKGKEAEFGLADNETRIEDFSMKRDDGTGRSAASQRRQAEIDKAEIIRSSRGFNRPIQGRGPGY